MTYTMKNVPEHTKTLWKTLASAQGISMECYAIRAIQRQIRQDMPLYLSADSCIRAEQNLDEEEV